MTNYTLYIKPSAQKELDALNNPIFDRIDKKIMTLAVDPRPQGVKKLQGYVDQWRIRIGDYRVIYIIDDVRRTVNVTHIAHRRDVYQ